MADVEVTGTITRIFFEANGFCIAAVDAVGFQKLSVKGNLLNPVEGQEYIFYGKIEENRTYGGHTLTFSSYRTVLPREESGIFQYLVSTAKWVGPKTAEALIDAFGDETLKIIKTDPDRVAIEIPGITLERAREMAETLSANEALEAAQIEVNQLIGGVLGPATSRKAIERWKCDAAQRIRRNPFILQELRGIGFASADKVWQKLDMPLDSRRRHAAAALAALDEHVTVTGDTWVSYGDWHRMACGKLSGEAREDALKLLMRAKLVNPEDDDGFTLCSPRDVFNGETEIAGTVHSLNAFTRRDYLYPEIPLDGLEGDQADAARRCNESAVFIICGAPGTGKTYVTARIVDRLRQSGLKIKMCAPTGKAAKRMTQALAEAGGGTATTIHSLLEPEITPSGGFIFRRNASSPIEASVIVIDEFSMVDVLLCRSLFDAIAPGSRVIIVGDHYQLPSIGPGAVLRDMLAAGVSSVELKSIKRNAGLIVHACHKIKDGRTPAPADRLDFESGDNWRHINAPTNRVIEEIRGLISVQLPKLGYGPWDIQIISPTNTSGPLSCEAINDMARMVWNPTAREIGKLPIREGDRVVRLRNASVAGYMFDSEKDKAMGVDADVLPQGQSVQIVNGDVGEVVEICKRNILVLLRDPGRLVWVSRSDHELRPAWCMTCHKMQGSESHVVILPLSRSFSRMPLFSREWIYTAFSRAKVMLLTVGDLGALPPGLERQGTQLRNTRLEDLIADMREEAELL